MGEINVPLTHEVMLHLTHIRCKIKLYTEVPFLSYQLGKNPKIHTADGKENGPLLCGTIWPPVTKFQTYL